MLLWLDIALSALLHGWPLQAPLPSSCTHQMQYTAQPARLMDRTSARQRYSAGASLAHRYAQVDPVVASEPRCLLDTCSAKCGWQL